MRRPVTVLVMATLMVGTVATSAVAGDPHAVRNRWAGAAIGAATVVAGGLLLSALAPPVAAAAPPVVYAPPAPAVVYAPPPVVYVPPAVVYAPPPVLYAPPVYGPPVIVHRGWGPPGRWRHHRHWRHDDD